MKIFFSHAKKHKKYFQEKKNFHSRFVILLWPFSMSQKGIPLVCMVMSMHTRWAKWTKFLLKPRGEDLRFGLYISISTCMGLCPWPQVLPCPQLIFFLPKPGFLGIYLNFFSHKKSLEKSIISHILNPNLTK